MTEYLLEWNIGPNYLEWTSKSNKCSSHHNEMNLKSIITPKIISHKDSRIWMTTFIPDLFRSIWYT